MENNGEGEDYKRLHEIFVSNGTGSDSPVEILSISTIPHFAVLLNGLLVFSIKQIWNDEPVSSKRSTMFLCCMYLLDFAISTLPLLLSLTCMSEDWVLIIIALSLTTACLFVVIKRGKRIIPKNNIQKVQTLKRGSKSHRKPLKIETPVTQPRTKLFTQMTTPSGKMIDYITNYRSSMLLVTAICILAVDFPVFPRRFGKTENFGLRLMDIGKMAGVNNWGRGIEILIISKKAPPPHC